MPEAVDYNALGERPATQWMGRVIRHCWPMKAREATEGAAGSSEPPESADPERIYPEPTSTP